MDIATVIGLLCGVFFILLGMVGKDFEPERVWMYFNIPSVFIVLGGSLGSVLVAMPLRNVLASWKVALKLFLFRLENANNLIARMVRFAEIARRDGILALENVANQVDDKFLQKGIQLAVDGTDPEQIDEIMNTEMMMIEERHAAGKKVFEVAGAYAPAWGMIGTLVGLIAMLAHLDDASKIGPNMAVALITTLYGSLLANFIFLPITDKLGKRSQEEMTLKKIVLQGVMAIQVGDNPRIVEQKLRIFLPPRSRGEKAGMKEAS